MTDKNQFWRLTARQLGELLVAGELSPVELLDETLKRIERVNPAINAIIAIDDKGARAAAHESEQRLLSGQQRGPLEGIPLAVKDHILVKNVLACWGSKLFVDFIPETDELPVARLREAGAVILGKTNVPEFTLAEYTDNPVHGVTRNPWNLELTPGGSSGGSVAAVAAGLVPLAIGTDGGGSIRRPASHTGLVGFKPSIGSVARCNGFPKILLDMEVCGPFGRTVADTRIVFDAMAGPSRLDRRSNLVSARGESKEKLKILYVERFGDSPLDPEVASSVKEAADTLANLGHEVVSGALPFDLSEVTEAWPKVGAVGISYLFDLFPDAPDLVSERFLELAAQGAATTSAQYLGVIETIDKFRGQVGTAFTDIDIIMTPTAAALPWQADIPFPNVIDGQTVGRRGHAVYTGWVNVCGHPAINLPAAHSKSGLPIGFQLIGDFGADLMLFKIAAQFEKVSPWFNRWPKFAENS
jgi:aspartyl-tRNA(Asn)/glutamyl-tRNA(Gln) amidotransferase subunit A